MCANNVCQRQTTQFGHEFRLGTRRGKEFMHLPQRSFRQRFLIAPADNFLSLTMVRYPAIDGDCRHQVCIEHATMVKRFDLPATGSIDISKQFVARVGEQLSFEYVVLLQAGHNSHFGLSTVTADLIDLTAPVHVSLINRSVTSSGEPGDKRVASRSRESLSIPIGAAGPYELRLATSVDPQSSGSSAHLLIDSVRICEFSGTTITQLASVSCGLRPTGREPGKELSALQQKRRKRSFVNTSLLESCQQTAIFGTEFQFCRTNRVTNPRAVSPEISRILWWGVNCLTPGAASEEDNA